MEEETEEETSVAIRSEKDGGSRGLGWRGGLPASTSFGKKKKNPSTQRMLSTLPFHIGLFFNKIKKKRVGICVRRWCNRHVPGGSGDLRRCFLLRHGVLLGFYVLVSLVLSLNLRVVCATRESASPPC